MRTRLHSIDEGVADRLLAADVRQVRAAALASSRAAAEAVGPADRRFLDVLDQLDAGAGITAELARTIHDLAERLDAEYLDLAEASEDGGGDKRTVLHAFSLARAASSVACTLESTRDGYLEAIYEAQAATDDWRTLRRLVEERLNN